MEIEFEMDNNSTNEHLINLFDKISTVSLSVSSILVILGILGNSLTIFIFSQKRFRKNSSSVYLLCLAINDNIYLVIYFCEEIIKNLNYVYSINLIPISEVSLAFCRLVNYFKYSLRFVSAYSIVAFTIQRLIIVYSPLSNRFKSKRSAWLTLATICSISFLLNFVIFFLFEINSSSGHCVVTASRIRDYFYLNFIHVCLIMVVPICVIFVANSLIIRYLNKSCMLKNNIKMNKRKSRYLIDKLPKKRKNLHQMNLENESNNGALKFRVLYLNLNQIMNKITGQVNTKKRITKLLVFISFSYAVFNLPYFLSWSLFQLSFAFKDAILYLMMLVKLSELFYLVNYMINFYIYCLSGSVFRNQLKFLGN